LGTHLNLPTNVSNSVRKRNPHLFGGLASGPQPEPDPGHATVAAHAREDSGQGRCSIRITSFRLRLCDLDNLYVKHYLDALVESRLVPGDDPQHADIEVCQIKVQTAEKERTEILIQPL
jgi:hypothetical protein